MKTGNTNPAKNTGAAVAPESTLRGMTYGAPELKALYKKFMSRGMAFSIAFHVFLIAVIMISFYISNLNAEKNNDQVRQIITIVEPPVFNETDNSEPPPVEVEKIIQKTVKDLTALTPTPVPKVDAEEVTSKTQDQLQDINTKVGKENIDGVNNITDGTLRIDDIKIDKNIDKDNTTIKDNKDREHKPFEVEKAPSPVNLGEVQGSMRYPEIAITSGTEGRVTVSVLVDKNGSVIKVGKISGPSVFHSEVKSKVYDLAFTPALQNGTKVKCWVSVPFNFKLKSKFGSDNE